MVMMMHANSTFLAFLLAGTVLQTSAFQLQHKLGRSTDKLRRQQSAIFESSKPTQAPPANEKETEGGYQFGDLFLNKVGKHVTGKTNYKFGDLSKAVGKTLASKDDGKPVSGKDDGYKFGDVSRWLDSSAKQKINDITGKKSYEFGDLTKYLDRRAKGSVAEFTQRDKYVVGDISKEVIRRAASGEYNTEDMFLLLRVLAAFGATYFTPVAASVPLTFLLKMYTCGIEMDVASRFTELIAQSVDKRFKAAVTGDEGYQLGDVTKKQVMKYVGKEDHPNAKYEAGDFVRALGKQAIEKKIANPGNKGVGNISPVDGIKTMLKSPEFLAELTKIDKASGFSPKKAA